MATALKICLFSSLHNLSFTFGPYIHPGMDLYTDDMWASHVQAKNRQCYLSQNIGPAVSGSAGPAQPSL